MTLHIAVNNQDILSNKLMCAIRAEIMKPEIDVVAEKWTLL